MKFFDKTHKNMSLRAKLAYIQNHERKDEVEVEKVQKVTYKELTWA